MCKYKTIVKIPKINDELTRLARNHKHTEKVRLSNIYSYWLNKYPEGSLSVQRQTELKDLIYMYSYLNDTQGSNINYLPYIDTLEELLLHGGLKITKSARKPVNQFKLTSIKRIVASAMEKLFPTDTIEVIKDKRRQDDGVDLVFRKQNIMISSSKQEGYISENSELGTIGSYLINDRTKSTEYILWTWDNFEDGYIVIIGLEKWSDIRRQIQNRNGWESYRGYKGAVNNKKKMKDFNGTKFPEEKIGHFTREEELVLIRAGL